MPDEGYVLVRRSDGYKSENPFSFPADENAQSVIDDFYAEKAEDEPQPQ